MNIDTLTSKDAVVKALDHAVNEDMSAIRNYWDMYMSLEQQCEFNDSFVLFESVVRRRYNLMTGDTL